MWPLHMARAGIGSASNERTFGHFRCSEGGNFSMEGLRVCVEGAACGSFCWPIAGRPNKAKDIDHLKYRKILSILSGFKFVCFVYKLRDASID